MTILNHQQLHSAPMELLRRDESLSLKEEEPQRLPYHDALPELQLDDEECSSVSSSEREEDEYLKTVRFSIQPTVVHEYLHFRDMTDEERLATWMTYEDRLEIVSDVKRIKANQEDGDFSESRGLEPRRKRFLRNTRMVVLQEQERQRRVAFMNMQYDHLESSEVLIATKYALATQGSDAIAHDRAKQDYLEVVQERSMEALCWKDDENYDVFYDSSSSDESDNNNDCCV